MTNQDFYEIHKDLVSQSKKVNSLRKILHFQIKKKDTKFIEQTYKMLKEAEHLLEIIDENLYEYAQYN